MGIFKGFKIGNKEMKRKGGIRATFFVFAMEGLENMAYLSIIISIITYIYGYMNFNLTKSATTVTNFVGTAFLVSLFPGFLSDTYLSRFKTAVVFGIIEALGYALLAIQARFSQLRPAPCRVPPDERYQCEAATGSQVALLYTGMYLVAFGTSGIKAAVPALGADQFNEKDPKEAAQMNSYFNWLMLSITTGGILGVTVLVWISTNVGWDWTFGISSLSVLFGLISLCMGKSFYRNNEPQKSPLTRIAQVFVAAIRNRDFPIPDTADELHEVYDKEVQKEIIQRTHQFRFLDRAAIVRPTKEASAASNEASTWRLCTVTQVEETKILIRMMPFLLTTIFMNTCLAQLQTFTAQQSTTMDTNLLGFKIPGPSIPAIPLLFMSILIPLYDRVFVPAARRITGIPTGIRYLQRIGVGLVLSIISMAVAGFVETKRKSVAFKHNMVDSNDPLPMSVFWLGLQYSIFGAADMFSMIGLLEFFYSESSANMKSFGTAISWCSIAFGYFLSSALVEVVNKSSGGWLASNNLNRDKLNYFYWLLSGLSTINFGVYLLCASWYKYKKVEFKQVENTSDNGTAKGNVEMIGV